MISDLVLLDELPQFIKNSVEAYIDCPSGALLKNDYLNKFKAAGFQDVKLVEETSFPLDFIVKRF